MGKHVQHKEGQLLDIYSINSPKSETNTRRVLEGETTPQEGQGFTCGGQKDAMMRTSENRNFTIGPSGWRQRLATANDNKHEEYRSGDEEGKRADKDGAVILLFFPDFNKVSK